MSKMPGFRLYMDYWIDHQNDLVLHYCSSSKHQYSSLSIDQNIEHNLTNRLILRLFRQRPEPNFQQSDVLRAADGCLLVNPR